jgi:hypothetical protein
MKLNEFKLEIENNKKYLCSVRTTLLTIKNFDSQEDKDAFSKMFIDAINGFKNLENKIFRMQGFNDKMKPYDVKVPLGKMIYISPSKRNSTVYVEIESALTEMYNRTLDMSSSKNYLNVIEDDTHFKLDIDKGYFRVVNSIQEKVEACLDFVAELK